MPTKELLIDEPTIEGLQKSLSKFLPSVTVYSITKPAKGTSASLLVRTPLEAGSQITVDPQSSRCKLEIRKRTVTVNIKHFSVVNTISKNEMKTEFRLHKLTSKVKADVRETFLLRGHRAVENLRDLPESDLYSAISAPTDLGVLTTALASEEALALARPLDPLAGAKLRAIEAKSALLDSEGGALSTAEVTGLLRITRQAVDKRRREGKLLAIELGRKGFLYPAWQFDLPHLQQVLVEISSASAWAQISFFLNPQGLLGDERPLDVLRRQPEKLPQVLEAAQDYMEHGA